MSPPASVISDFRLLSQLPLSVSGFMTFLYIRHNFGGVLTPYIVIVIVALTMFPVSIDAGSVFPRRDVIVSDEISSRRAVPRDCAPVPHDTLWLRFNLESSGSSNTYVDYQRDDNDDEINDDIRRATSKKSTSAIARRNSSRRRRTLDSEQHHQPKPDALGRQSKTDDDDADYNEETAPTMLDIINNTTSGVRLRRHPRKTSFRGRPGSDSPNAASGGGVTDTAAGDQQQQQQPPWHCHMETEWKKQPEGTFPRYLQTGKCRQKRCMAGYECRPRKYATRVLRRLEGRCNPVATTDGRVAYEEAWVVDEVRVTVGCECSRKPPTGTYGVLLGGPYYR